MPTVPKDTTQLKSVARVISSCFDPYMGAYVKFERKYGACALTSALHRLALTRWRGVVYTAH